MTHRPLAALLPCLFALGCASAPHSVLGITPYRIEIQQGNYVARDALAQLKPGMTKEQVRFILGTPLIADLFHADRWDYVFYSDRAQGGREETKIAVYFEDGKLARVVGEAAPAARPGAGGAS